MNKRLAILSTLLRYPDEALRADLPDVMEAIATAGFNDRDRRALERLARRLSAGDPLDRQEDFVRLFDRGRSTSLHLFEHVHGDTRNRGPAMVELAAVYDAAGFAMAGRELPDYLPLVLEFCAVAPPETAANLLGQAGPLLQQIHAKLMSRGLPSSRGYAAVLAAVLSEVALAPVTLPTDAQDQADEDDLAAIDAAYEDQPVVFGPESDPDREGARAKVAAMIQRLRSMRQAAAKH
ncbi:nitrate reductase molybdenum cofactor assembly chaperone [Roseomonas eburnea]|uniref:Nitrate reductase molybdenum cofactor assembly chaperone n=1 Tax=Neoroseomonas eburnea TaxID=1346889 RepID=A0A9X9XFF1_9PROT|nr:nitrate reductase molybdenum cofactor assembly chaperone [Neoroseomonas eburnea]